MITIGGTLLERATAHRMGLDLMRGEPDAVAIITDAESITYAGLRRLVAERSEQLGDGRRLVLIETENALEPIVTYLAALSSGHVAMLVPAATSSAVLERYDPDVVLLAGALEPEHRRLGTAHRLHPDLALLLSTSGSTGSPKLVRLSRRNLLSNADAIAQYLNLTPADRAITTLPFSYCYGLSVINSHLAAGAGLRLTERSVVEPEFWNDFRSAGCTSFAGVPYTFDLLDSAGFAERDLSTLRYVTQAGGRLEPERVRAYARLGSRRGFDFVVMYGQTEATARMAYLPPQLAEERAGMIGVPIPGGELSIESAGPDGVGELVYRGDNVMMGYAESPGDLARGSELNALRTGDLARRHPDGLVEVVGRVSRFVKVFGLRVDLDRVERLLRDEGIEARALGVDERLTLAVRRPEMLEPAASVAARLLRLPEHSVQARLVPEFPRTPTGKPDWAALTVLAAGGGQRSGGAMSPATDHTPDGLRRLYAELLERPDACLDDSFTSLDGDSLSYVEVSVRLEEVLGTLPDGWPSMSVRRLAALGPATAKPTGRTWTARLETPLVLRAAAIFLVTATHANLLGLQGGAHLLLALLGLNVARFQLASPSTSSRVRGLLRTAAGIAVPAGVWIGAVTLTTGMYQPSTALLINQFFGGDRWSVQWQFWFLEVAVWSLVGLAAVAAVPRLTRLDRRHPFAVATVAFVATMAVRLAVAGIEAGPVERYSLAGTVWLIALGWVIARANGWRTRAVSSLFVVASVFGFLGDPGREAVVVVGLLLAVWIPSIPVPRAIVPAVRILAAASLFIYLVHWQVYPWLEYVNPALATLASFAAGIAAWQVHRLARTALKRPLRSARMSAARAMRKSRRRAAGRAHDSAAAPAERRAR